MPVAEISLKGAHNVENVLAAVCAGMLAGVDPADIRRAVANFKAVEHRLEYVATVRGVQYYNDSKATNVDATIKALESFPGRHSPDPRRQGQGQRLQRSESIAGRSGSSAFTPSARPPPRSSRSCSGAEVVSAGTIDNAVRRASEAAAPGDIVLLAPACASFDQFVSYEHRGRVFKDLVRQMEAREAAAGGQQPRRRQGIMAKRVSVDKWLFTVTLLLVFLGLVMVFSASAVMAKERFGSPYSFLLRQLGWAAAGIAAMLVVMNIDYKQYRRSSVVFTFLGLTCLLLMAVFLFHDSHNTHRWIKLGPLSFQPSELAKPAIILYLAYFLESRWQQIADWKHVLLPGRCAQRAVGGAHRERARPRHGHRLHGHHRLGALRRRHEDALSSAMGCWRPCCRCTS